MAENESGERTEEATQQRREDFRRRGQVAQTRELSSVLLFLTMVGLAWLLGHFFLEQMQLVFTRSLGDFIVSTAREGNWLAALKFAGLRVALVVGPVIGILWIVGIASSLLQVGFLSNDEALKLEFSRLDPAEGLKRLFSLKALVEGLKSLIKLVVVGSLTYLVVKGEIQNIPQLSGYSIEQLLVFFGRVSLKLFGGVGVFMAVIAIMDYFYQRWELEKRMMMTKQEVKEELKSREGDPLIRARIRRVQREMAQKRMMEQVPKAEVIITNPTHIAVALKYTDAMVAPVLVAKGAGYIAEKIKSIAREHNVPIVENKPLARTIFKSLKIGQVIPRDLYTAVAEVLSFIIRLKRKVVK